MADLVVRIAGDTGGFDKAIESVGKSTSEMGKHVAMAMAAVGVAVVGAGVAATKMAADFDKGMREVNTLINLSEQEFTDLRSQTSDLAARLGVDAVGATKALYQAISAGVPKDNALEFLTIASKAAIGGVTDTETAVNGITSAVNAFSAQGLEAGRAADIMFATVKAGKTDFGALSGAMANVAPISASMGVSFAEVSAAMATLTLSGDLTSVASTKVRSALVALAKPSAEMTKLFKAAGFESGEAAVKQLGFAGAADIVAKAAGGSIGKLTALLGSSEAVGAVLGVTGDQAETFAGVLDGVTNSTGAADAAYEEMNKSLDRQLALLKGELDGALREIGFTLLPIVISAVQRLKEGWERLRPALQTAWERLQDIAATLQPMVTEILPALALAFGTLTTVVFPALVGAFQKVMDTGAKVIQFFKDHQAAVDALGAVLVTLAAVGIARAISALPALIVQVVASTAAFIAQAAAATAAAIATAAAALPFIAIVAVIAGVIFVLSQLVRNFDQVMAAANSLSAVVVEVGRRIGEFGGQVVQMGVDMVLGLVDGINRAKDAVVGAITGVVGGALDAAKRALGISSPSAVFASQVGEPIAEGIAEGIEAATPDIEDALDEAVRPTVTAALAGRQAFRDWRDAMLDLAADSANLEFVREQFEALGVPLEEAIASTIALRDESVAMAERVREEAEKTAEAAQKAFEQQHEAEVRLAQSQFEAHQASLQRLAEATFASNEYIANLQRQRQAVEATAVAERERLQIQLQAQRTSSLIAAGEADAAGGPAMTFDQARRGVQTTLARLRETTANIGGAAGLLGDSFMQDATYAVRYLGLGGLDAVRRAIELAGGIPSFANGGLVPGLIGTPMLATVHGGEMVLPAGVSRGGGTVELGPATIKALARELTNLTLTVGVDDVHKALLRKAGRNSGLGLT